MIKVNGTLYDVELLDLQRSLKKTYKYDIYTEGGQRCAEVKAIYPVFDLVIGNLSPKDYDKLYRTICTSAVMTFTLPQNHTADESVEVMCDGLSDGLQFALTDGTRWFAGMKLTLVGINPIEGN